jgi:hypothetical protein
MSEKPFYNVPDILHSNGTIKQTLSEVIIDLNYLSEEFADHLITGQQVINKISSIVLDLEQAYDDMIVEEEE